MMLKKLSVLICFLFLIILSLGNISAVACSIETEDDCLYNGNNVVMGLSDSTNAHGELADPISYDYVLCCDFGLGYTDCSSTLDDITNQPINKIIGLSSSTNAHAEIPDILLSSSAYTSNDVCYDGVKDCASTAANCVAADGEIKMDITLSSDTNAHIGGYDTKICCKLQCDLTSAYWSENGSTPIEEGTSVREGVLVDLIVEGENCDWGEISFEVWEDDVDDDDPIIGDNPSNVGFSGNNATGTWRTEWQDDSDGDGDLPEYYFNASVIGTSETINSQDEGSELLSVTEFKPEDYCDIINYCSNYPNPGECESDAYLCKVAEASAPSEIDCGSGYNCSCVWTEGVCGPKWTAIGGYCGNDIINPGETCDGSDWGISLTVDDCDKFDAFAGGSLACYAQGETNECHFDTSGCSGGNGPGPCNNSIVNSGEECDGTDWGGITGCSNFDEFDGGTLSCSSTCMFDTSLCTGGSGDVPSAIGSCTYDEDTTSDNCDDGFLTYSWTATWTWDVDNPEHNDPNNAAAKCVGGEKTIPCPAQLELPFFSIYNVIAALILIVLIYAILIWKKKKVSSKKGAKKKK